MTDKFIIRFVAGVSAFVIIVVIILNRHIIPGPAVAPSFTFYLPLLNAILNGTCTVLLLTSLYFIKQGNIAVHKRLNIITFCLSALFLVSYIAFHYLMQHDTLYGDTNGDSILSPAERDAAGGLRTLISYYINTAYHIGGRCIATNIAKLLPRLANAGCQTQKISPLDVPDMVICNRNRRNSLFDD